MKVRASTIHFCFKNVNVQIYLRRVEIIYGNTTTDYSSISNHTQCVSTVENVAASWIPKLNYFITNVSNVYINACTWKAKLDVSIYRSGTDHVIFGFFFLASQEFHEFHQMLVARRLSQAASTHERN